jgi:2-(1,2-epoxy-1,2-dihydrophenyl)acetyl-CoA isomerase
MSDRLRVVMDDLVARITLTRPDAANTIGLELARELRQTVATIAESGARVVVIDAEGATFCGGGDLREVAAAADPPAHISAIAATYGEALAALLALDAVVIVQVDGAVAGGGLGLVLHADLVVASDHSRFLTAFDRLGASPDSGVTSLLPRAIGITRALELSLTGRELDAATARDWGLVTQVVAPAELAATVDAHVHRLAASPVDHYVVTRRLYRAVPDDHAARIAEEARLIGESARRPDTRARIDRFLPKPERGDGS